MTDTMLTLDGISQPITEWALDYGIYPAVITERLERGWAVERAITTPMAVAPSQQLNGEHLPGLRDLLAQKRAKRPKRPKQPKPPKTPKPSRSRATTIDHNGLSLTIAQWSERSGVAYTTLRRRLLDGWLIEHALTVGRMNGRGRVVKNFLAFEGTGGGRHAQDISELEFSE